MAEPQDRNIVPDKDDIANHPEKQMTGGALGTGKEQQGDQPTAGRRKSDQASVVAPTPRSVKDLPAGQGTDPRTQDQQSAGEEKAERTVDKGDADRRVKE